VTPEGILLRGVSTIEECRFFDSFAVLDSAGRLQVILGRDFRSMDNKFAGNMLSIANAMIDNFVCRVYKQDNIYPALADRIKGPAVATGAVLINQPGNTGTWVNPTRYVLGASNMASKVPVAIFAVAHNAVAGSGLIEYANRYLDGSTGGATGWGMSAGGFISVGLTELHRFLLNNTVEEILVAATTKFEHYSEQDVKDQAKEILDRLRAAFPKLMKSQASIMFNLVRTATGPRFVVPQRGTRWDVTGGSGWPVGYGNVYMPQQLGSRASFVSGSDYHTVNEQSVFANTTPQIVKLGIEISELLCNSLNGSEAMPMVKQLLGDKDWRAWNDTPNASYKDYFTQYTLEQVSIPMPTSIDGIPIIRICGPVFGISTTDTNPWTLEEFINVLYNVSTPQDFAQGTVSGLTPTTEQTQAAWELIAAANNGSPLAQVDWRATWTHEVDLLFFLDLLRIYAKDADSFDEVKFDQATTIWAQQKLLMEYGSPTP
jgi:hypothetical protein